MNFLGTIAGVFFGLCLVTLTFAFSLFMTGAVVTVAQMWFTFVFRGVFG